MLRRHQSLNPFCVVKFDGKYFDLKVEIQSFERQSKASAIEREKFSIKNA